jgi:hypothetical protein
VEYYRVWFDEGTLRPSDGVYRTLCPLDPPGE